MAKNDAQPILQADLPSAGRLSQKLYRGKAFMLFAPRWEQVETAGSSAGRFPMLSRGQYLKEIVGNPNLVVLVGPAGSGKTALAYQALATEGLQDKFEVLYGWSIPSTTTLREKWFADNSDCRAILVEDIAQGLLADTISFIHIAQSCGLKVILTSTTPMRLPSSHQVEIADLSVGEARELLNAQNSIAPQEFRLPAQTIDKIAQLAPKLRTPGALISLAYRFVSDPSKHVDDMLSHLEGTLFQSKASLVASEPSRIVVQQSLDNLIRDLRRQPESLFRLPSRRFEEIVAELLRDRGCIVHLTPSTRDGGFDMYASIDTPLGRMLCLVEAKRHAPDRPVGIELVRHLYGTLCANNANSAMLVTTSRFSHDAREFQSKFQQVLALRDYFDLTDWIATYGTTQSAAALYLPNASSEVTGKSE